MMFGPATFYILAAYGGVIVGLGVVTLWGVLRHRRFLKARIRLEIEVAYLHQRQDQDNTPLPRREAS